MDVAAPSVRRRRFTSHAHPTLAIPNRRSLPQANVPGVMDVPPIVMTTPLETGRSAFDAAATVSESAREFLRPVLVSDEALAEQRLIDLVKTGNRAAFGELVTRYSPRALSLGMRILHHREDAEDLVQD